MAPSIGLNLRVTGYKHQGGRRYMEDDFGVAYQQTSDEKDLEYAFFGIFDGHGGKEAALFAKVNFIFDIFNHFKKTQDILKCCFVFQEHLMDYIVTQKGFWEEEDDAVLKAIREGFIQTHYAMWKELGMKIELPKLNPGNFQYIIIISLPVISKRTIFGPPPLLSFLYMNLNM